MNVNIYYGGLSGFHTILPDTDDYMPLVDLVIKDDAKQREFKVDAEGNRVRKQEKIEHYETVIAFTEDYSSFSESFIESFVNLLFRYEIDNLYLQNPPNSIAKRMMKYSSINFTVKEHEYNTLLMEYFRAFKS